MLLDPVTFWNIYNTWAHPWQFIKYKLTLYMPHQLFHELLSFPILFCSHLRYCCITAPSLGQNRSVIGHVCTIYFINAHLFWPCSWYNVRNFHIYSTYVSRTKIRCSCPTISYSRAFLVTSIRSISDLSVFDQLCVATDGFRDSLDGIRLDLK